jgi:hypothetical protein
VHVTFDAPETSSDGGVLLLRSAEQRIGLVERMAACVPDARDPAKVEHPRSEQMLQRVLQIAMGYEDCNDADTLRDDPVFRAACDREAHGGRGLSSQPTLSRFENAVSGQSLRRMVDVLERDYVERLPADTQTVILDIDSTDDETHGAQQLTFFHGFYDQYMYHPLLVLDGDGQLVTVLLRPGNAHAARSARGTLTRLIRRIKSRFPSCQVVVRGDSGFCMPRLLEALEQLDRELGDIDYVLGLAKNPVLLTLAEPAMAQAQQLFAAGVPHVRHFATTAYAAKTWSHPRHVVIKAEHGERGPNPRFVVTTLTEIDPKTLYDVGYCARGQCENYIKDFKNALKADRLSCCRYVANFFRLLLHAVAYRLMYEVRRTARAVGSALGQVQMDTLRLRLLKVAAHVTQSVRRIVVRLPKAFPLADAFAAIARGLVPAPA